VQAESKADTSLCFRINADLLSNRGPRDFFSYEYLDGPDGFVAVDEGTSWLKRGSPVDGQPVRQGVAGGIPGRVQKTVVEKFQAH